jgi:hypothetical protein
VTLHFRGSRYDLEFAVVTMRQGQTKEYLTKEYAVSTAGDAPASCTYCRRSSVRDDRQDFTSKSPKVALRYVRASVSVAPLFRDMNWLTNSARSSAGSTGVASAGSSGVDGVSLTSCIGSPNPDKD